MTWEASQLTQQRGSSGISAREAIIPVAVLRGFEDLLDNISLSKSTHEDLVARLRLRQAGHDEEDLLDVGEVADPVAHTYRTVVRGMSPPLKAIMGFVSCILAVLAVDNVPFPGERRQAEADASRAVRRRPLPVRVASRKELVGIPVVAEAGVADQVVVRVHHDVANSGLERQWRIRPVVVEELALLAVCSLGRADAVYSDEDLCVLRSATTLLIVRRGLRSRSRGLRGLYTLGFT